MESPYRPVSKIATAETFTDIPEEGEVAANVRPARALTNSSRGSSGRGSSSGGDLRETAMAGTTSKNDEEAGAESKKGTEKFPSSRMDGRTHGQTNRIACSQLKITLPRLRKRLEKLVQQLLFQGLSNCL